MDAITLSAVIGEDRRLVIQLPDNAPVGPVKVVIEAEKHEAIEFVNPAREAARTKLLAAGKLVMDQGIPDNFEISSPDELEHIGRLLAGGRSTMDLIDEDRGAY